MNKETIYIGNDHGGYELKLHILRHLEQEGIPYVDVGCGSAEIVRYPYYAAQVAGAVSTGQASRGILICSTGIGMSIIANKYPNVRASLCTSTYTGRMTRAHNNSNILCLGGRTTGLFEALDILQAWLTTDYEGGRHDISLGLVAEAEHCLATEGSWNPDDPMKPAPVEEPAAGPESAGPESAGLDAGTAAEPAGAMNGGSGQLERIGIVGTGQIAVSMAVLMTGNGHPACMVSRSESSSGRARKAYDDYLQDLVKAGLITLEQVQRCNSLLTISQDYADIADSGYIIESVYENLEAKHAVYREIEAVCRPDVVIASMTSGLTPDLLSAEMAHPERLLVAHPFVPPHLVPCIEVVGSAKTSPEAIARTVELFESTGRAVIVLRKMVDGFIGNRLQHAMFREAVYMVEQGVASAEDIDRTLLTSFGPRYSAIGIFEHMENAGLDMCASIQAYLLPSLCREKSVQPSIAAKVAAGELGSKTGKGFLDWSKKDMDDLRIRRSQPYFKFFNWRKPE